MNFLFLDRNVNSPYGLQDFLILFQMIKDMKKQFSGLLYEIGFLDSTNPMAFSANYNSGISVWIIVSFVISDRIYGQQQIFLAGRPFVKRMWSRMFME